MTDGAFITGIFVRIQRDGAWGAIDIAELTDEELTAFFADKEAETLRRWVVTLAGLIRDHAVRDAR